MALLTRKSNPFKPSRTLIYGQEGVGKSTYGAKSDRPVFITPEGGTDRLTDSNGNPVEDIPGVNDWDGLIRACNDVLTQEHSFKTLVLDSADWIEALCHSRIIGKTGKSITTVNGGYGAGYRESQIMHKNFIDLLSQIRDKREMNIVITAHAHVKAVKDPEMMQDYDAFEIKCHEFVSSLWREWVDGLFFVRFKTFIGGGDDTTKARALTDGSRVLYTRKTPAFQAKNRYGMPPEMVFTENFWNDFQTYAKAGLKAELAIDIFSDCQDLLNKVSDEKLRNTISGFMDSNKENVPNLLATRNRLKDITATKGE